MQQLYSEHYAISGGASNHGRDMLGWTALQQQQQLQQQLDQQLLPQQLLQQQQLQQLQRQQLRQLQQQLLQQLQQQLPQQLLLPPLGPLRPPELAAAAAAGSRGLISSLHV